MDYQGADMQAAESRDRLASKDAELIALRRMLEVRNARIETLEATVTELLPLATAFLVYTYEPVKTAAILERAKAVVQQRPSPTEK